MEITRKNGVTTFVKEEDRPFRVLQLTDIHPDFFTFAFLPEAATGAEVTVV